MTIDLSGEWIFDGHPFDAPYAGQIRLTLKQSGTSISGDLLQLQDPFSGKPPADPEATRAEVAGELIEDTQTGNHLVILKRRKACDALRAGFVGGLSRARNSVSGTFINAVGIA